MRTAIFTIIIMLSLTSLVLAAPGDLIWQRTIGGAGTDIGYSINGTTDGGFIIAGQTGSYYPNGRYLVRTDANGNALWLNATGGAGDWFHSAQQTSDGGFVALGSAWIPCCPASWAMHMFKTDANGNAQWNDYWGGDSMDLGYDVIQMADGSYKAVGLTQSYGMGSFDWFVVTRFQNGGGNQTTWGGTSPDVAYSVRQTMDGGYIATGYTNSYGAGSGDVYVVKSGTNPAWTNTYGGTDSESGFCIRLTADGGYILVGQIYYLGTGTIDIYLVKIDASGNPQWTRTYGGTSDDVGRAVEQTPDGGYIIAGYTNSYGAGGWDCYLIKTNSSGDTLWTRTYGGASDDQAFSLVTTSDTGYVVVGSTASYGSGSNDVYLLKIEATPPPPCCDILMIPDAMPIIVPPGGSFGVTGYIGNPTLYPRMTDVWVGVRYLGTFYLLWNFQNIPLNPGQTLSAHITQNVPVFAPIGGGYLYEAMCGDFPDDTCDIMGIPFTVAGAKIDNGFTEWALEGGFASGETSQPSEYSLLEGHPNPFNATINISFELPKPGLVNLQIYNLMGQRVATLVDRQVEAGYHTVAWDGANYASGIYFYKMTVGDKVFTKRMTLLK